MIDKQKLLEKLKEWGSIAEAEQSEMVELEEDWKDRYDVLYGRLVDLVTMLKLFPEEK